MALIVLQSFPVSNVSFYCNCKYTTISTDLLQISFFSMIGYFSFKPSYKAVLDINSKDGKKLPSYLHVKPSIPYT